MAIVGDLPKLFASTLEDWIDGGALQDTVFVGAPYLDMMNRAGMIDKISGPKEFAESIRTGRNTNFQYYKGDETWTTEAIRGYTQGRWESRQSVMPWRINSEEIIYNNGGSDGKKLWDVRTDGPVNGSPVVVGDTTFVAGCDSKLRVLDAKTGNELGAVELDGQAAATAAVHGDAAYVGTMGNQVVAVNWKTYRKLWAFEAPTRQQPFYASAAVTKDYVIAGSRDAKLYAIHRDTGKQAWSFTTDGLVDSSPVVVGDRVYTGCLSREGDFYVLDVKTGRKVQELNLDSAVCGSIAVGPDCLLVGTDKGTLYCLGAK